MLIEGLGQGALQKELLVAPFVEHFKTAALGESYREILSVLETINSKIVFLQVALRKEQLVAPFAERLKTATLGKSY